MTIKIRKPVQQIICQHIYQKDKETYIPSGSLLFSGVTGRQIGTVAKALKFNFDISFLVCQTTGRNFTTKNKKYYFAETDHDGKILDDGLLVTKGTNLNFTSLNDFLIDQEIEFQRTLSPLQKYLYLAGLKVKAIFSMNKK